jgi:hypothetical protein
METTLAELALRVAAIEQRLSALEGAQPVAPVPDPGETNGELPTGWLSNLATHIGRILLIFGGAFLLRAITDEHVVPTPIGILMGTAYAGFWLWMAYRTGHDPGRNLNALFYGASSVFLALPLFVEATTHFELLTGRQGVVALSAYCALAIAVSMRRNLRILCWVLTAGSIATAFVVLNTSHSAVETALFLLSLGLATLWAAYRQAWPGVQWLGAAGADAGVLVLAVLSVSDRWAVEALTPFSIAALLLTAYLGSFAVRTHVRDRKIGLFEAVQTSIVVALAFLTAVTASHAGRNILTDAGILSLVLSACAYGMAFTPQTRAIRGRNFHYYSTTGLILLVAGSALIASPARAAMAWSLLALAMAWFSGRTGRVTLSLQCTFLLFAAGIASGVLATGFEALAGRDLMPAQAAPPGYLIVALATVACLFIPVAQRSDRWGVFAGLPQLLVLALSVWEVGGLLVVLAAPLMAKTGSADPDLAILAALRTGILAAASVTLALSSRFNRWPEARWLVYPVLVLVGFKFLLEDFPNGRPVTLFVAFALLGSALILVAKLTRRESPQAAT